MTTKKHDTIDHAATSLPTLYYAPLACSLAARIVSLEGGVPLSLCRADLSTKRVDGGHDGELAALNPMGKVPTLACADGTVITENVAVLLYLADRTPDPGLGGSDRTLARYEVIQWLAFVATELHKRVLAVAFSLDDPADLVRNFARAGAAQALAVLEGHLGDRQTLVGERFTVADAYLFWSLLLLPQPPCGIALGAYPAVAAYAERHSERASVREALRVERREYGEPGWWTASQLQASRRQTG